MTFAKEGHFACKMTEIVVKDTLQAKGLPFAVYNFNI